MKRTILSVLTLLIAAAGVQAASWKIGPSSVNGMDFADINDAMASTKVAAGDTLYLDQYFSTSKAQEVTKQVVIIGTGYDTSLTDEQVVATVNNTLRLKAKGIVVKSTKLTTVNFYQDDCVIDRCYATCVMVSGIFDGMNHVWSCYIDGGGYQKVISGEVESGSDFNGSTTYSYAKFDIQNCVIISNRFFNSDFYCIYGVESSIINNNTIMLASSASNSYCQNSFGLGHVTNSQITNNLIFYTSRYTSSNYPHCFHSEVYAKGSGNTIEHNIVSETVPSNYLSNKYYAYGGFSDLFASTGNYSAYYKLNTSKNGNPALGYATDGGEVGCHGGMFGCAVGGRPQYIPYFSKVTVGSRTENGKLPVSVTVKIQDE